MSAEKCGTVISFEIFNEAKQALQEGKPPLVVSKIAYNVYNKIVKVYPNFSPSSERDIWVKAHKMGYLDE